jgi:H+-translocating NAD(P) transhydrogenase subunit alpha
LRRGTVIIDLAAERGGNCELTRPGENYERGGVLILGPLNLPATAPVHASQMYSKNVQTFLSHLVKDGKLNLDLKDEIVSSTLVTHAGEVVNPSIRKMLEEAGT